MDSCAINRPVQGYCALSPPQGFAAAPPLRALDPVPERDGGMLWGLCMTQTNFSAYEIFTVIFTRI